VRDQFTGYDYKPGKQNSLRLIINNLCDRMSPKLDSRTLGSACCPAREKSTRMKTGLLSALIASPALALRSLPLAILFTLGSGGNLYALGPEYGTSSAPALLSQRDAVVKQVQLALWQRGYYAYAIDGFMGPYTREAIQRFEVDHCLRTAPLITRRLLIALGIERDGKSVVGPKSVPNVRPPVVD
jgi:hypothetical protein